MLPLVLLLLVAGAWFWLLHTQSGARWIWAQVEAATDGALSVVEISGAISSGLVARDVRYVADGVDISIVEASLSANVDLLPLRVTVLPARVSELLIDLSGEEQSEEVSTLQETFAKLQMPVELVFTEVNLVHGRVDGIGDDLDIVVDSFTLAGRWKNSWLVERFSLESEAGAATGNGSFALFEDNELYLDVDVSLASELTGLEDTISVEATVQGPLDDLVGQGRAINPRAFWHSRIVGLTGEPRWEMHLELPGFELPSDAGTVSIPPIALTANARGDKNSFVAEADVGFADTDMRVKLAARIDMDAETVSSNVEWDRAHWPIGDTEPQVSSQTGALKLSGSLSDWTVAGTIDLAVPELPPGTLTIDGDGDDDGADVRILEGKVLGGAVSGRARYSWSEPRTYSAELLLEGVRTGGAFPDWPAILSGKVELVGRQEPFSMTATLSDISGEFRSRRLEANGGVDIRDGSVSVKELRVVHGDAFATVDGELYGRDGLRFDVALGELGQYVEDAFGSLTASGSVSLLQNNQFLRLNASAEELGWGNVTVDNLAIFDHGSGTDVFDAFISAGSVTVDNVDIGQLQVRPRLGRAFQELEVDVISARGRTGLSLVGKLDDWNSPSSWAGELGRLEFGTENIGASLGEAAGVRIDTISAAIEPFCLSGIRGGTICGEASWDSNAGGEITSNLSSVSLDAVNVFVDTRLDFEQVVSGSFLWRSRPEGGSSGRADISMTAGKIVSSDDPELFLETGPARLIFDLQDDSLRGGLLDIPFPGFGQIAAEFELLDVTEDGAADLHGLIDIDIEDIGFLVALIPVVDDAHGILRADLKIAGNAAEPLVTGDFLLEHGSLSYLPTGLKLDEIELQSELQENGEIELTGSLRAGDGRAEVRTRADHALTAATGLELMLRGENLTVIDVPDIRAVANADLRVNFDGQTLDMNGNIAIPYARVRPANIGSTRVSESEDVVIIAGELPDEPTDADTDTDIEFSGTVAVALGDDVVVDLEVSEMQVTGSAEFTWSGGPIPSAIGRYDIDGQILAFGQRLDITVGSLRFEDVPADDPYLRVRAEREIFGNTDVRRAGVLVAGELSRPTIEPYTDPVTTEERALTLLVTGSDFDIDQGVGAIDLGTYVAPRVFVSYGIGMFEEENVIRIRYDLQRGFGVTGTSGGRDAGVDLSYRFEN
jgi:translocation and assembly module TamB